MASENTCSSRTANGLAIVTVHGEVDLSWSGDIRENILAALDGGRGVLVELGDVTYIDSSGIAALVEGYQTARAEGLKFGLIGLSDAVRAVLELARLDQVFPIYADLEAAMR